MRSGNLRGNKNGGIESRKGKAIEREREQGKIVRSKYNTKCKGMKVEGEDPRYLKKGNIDRIFLG